ncbi:MAG: cyclase family protein [Saprospiraceae bacterium]|nr:cyclase family protein [Saprospiraceae bacterium]
MVIQFLHRGKSRTADLSKPMDISIPLVAESSQVNCFYAPLFEVSPVVMGSFIGDTQQGGAVNFMNVRLNPHGNGTHTECIGHIAVEPFSIHRELREFHHVAKLITLYPSIADNGDRVILYESIKEHISKNDDVVALIVRTLPNHTDKLHRQYSGTNPPYFHHQAIAYLVACGIQHLLVDLPSVDREEDGGQLLAHRAYWQYPDAIRRTATITELIFVPNEIQDGVYLLNLQIASFDIDVSPSKPILYDIT